MPSSISFRRFLRDERGGVLLEFLLFLPLLIWTPRRPLQRMRPRLPKSPPRQSPPRR